MKLRRPTKFQTFLLICLALLIIHRVFFRAPSEDEMIAKFHQHKTEFEQILLMLKQDKNIGTIGDHWVTGADGEDTNIPKEKGIIFLKELPINVSSQRIELYRYRLKKLGFSRVDSREGNVQLELFGGGFTDTTWGIGYFYSEKIPKYLVKSAYSQMPGRDKRHFSRIEGNWYIYQRR